MPRHSIKNLERTGQCKIRKRVSSSTSPASSSSSLVKNYRFKRAIVVGKRAGSSTPVPTWKIMASRSSPLKNVGQHHNNNNNNNNHHLHHHHHHHHHVEGGVRYGSFVKVGGYNCGNNNGEKGKESLLSARTLGATLWEINGVHSPGKVKESPVDDKKDRDRERKSCEKSGKQQMFDSAASAAEPVPDNSQLLDQSHSPVCEKTDGYKGGRSHRRRPSATSHKLQLTEYMAEGGGLDSVANAAAAATAAAAASNEVTTCHAAMDNFVCVKSRLKDVSNSLTASKELVRVLYRIWSQEEQQSSRLTLVSALRVELDRARNQVDHLIQEQRHNQTEMTALLKQLAAEKLSWKNQQEARIRDAISSASRELEVEKKLRKQAERLNKKLGLELADTRAELSNATKELESERRAREILEQTCDELARGIGEDRAEFEELKKESMNVREEVDRERQMLQLADVLREERVQMKLTDAKYEYEEKNAALERLRNELELYFNVAGREEGGMISLPNLDDQEQNREFADFLKQQQSRSCRNGADDRRDDSGCDDEELHSIELNTDNNKMYKWSFGLDGGTGNSSANGDSRRASVDEVFKGRRSLSEKIQWESICLQKKTSDGGAIEWDFTTSSSTTTNSKNNNNNNSSSSTSNKQQQQGHGNGNGIDRGRRSSDVSANGERNGSSNNGHQFEIKRYRSFKGRRDQVLMLSSCLDEGSQYSDSPIVQSPSAAGETNKSGFRRYSD